MKTSSTNSWWREMGAISRGMMFIEGALATPVAQDRAEQDFGAAARPQPTATSHARRSKQGKKTFGLYEDLLFLGGRPMTAGHNDDIDEPFPQTRAGAPRRSGGRRDPAPQPQPCATC